MPIMRTKDGYKFFYRVLTVIVVVTHPVASIRAAYRAAKKVTADCPADYGHASGPCRLCECGTSDTYCRYCGHCHRCHASA